MLQVGGKKWNCKHFLLLFQDIAKIMQTLNTSVVQEHIVKKLYTLSRHLYTHTFRN